VYHLEIATAGIDSCEEAMPRNRLQVDISIEPDRKHHLLSGGRDPGECKSSWSKILALLVLVYQLNGSFRVTGCGGGTAGV
jgi:hypothetical protein